MKYSNLDGIMEMVNVHAMFIVGKNITIKGIIMIIFPTISLDCH